MITTNRRSRILVINLSLLILMALPTLCDAARWRTCGGSPQRWSGERISIHPAAVSFGSDPRLAAALRYSVNTFFNRNASEFDFRIMDFDHGNFSTRNGRNQIAFTADDIGAPAVAYRTTRCYWWFFAVRRGIVEGDVLFSNRSRWDFGNQFQRRNITAWRGRFRPFYTTALHELGHVAGLSHESRVYNIMGSDPTHLNATTNGEYLPSVGEDAGLGLVRLYGRGNQDDLAVTSFVRTGASGEYSAHDFGLIRDTNQGFVLQWRSYPVGRRFDVARGQLVDVPFTFENPGGVDHRNVRVSFYISANMNISDNDIEIGSRAINFLFDSPRTVTTTLRIPDGLVFGGTYYLGVVINSDLALEEDWYHNNTAYHPIRIRG